MCDVVLSTSIRQVLKTNPELARYGSWVHYTIVGKDLGAHLFHVTVTIDNPDPKGQVFSLPAWIPGSYMIREFARNIVTIAAESDGRKVGIYKLDKHSWQVEPCEGLLTVGYDVYAWDLSVRSAHLDQTHGFFNGPSVFLEAKGQSSLPHVVEIGQPDMPIAATWKVATALKPLDIRKSGFGAYIARDYDELIDSPVEMGEFACGHFNAYGVPHEIIVTGRIPNLDMERLENDLRKICEAEISLFEPDTDQAPFERYVFFVMAVKDGYGGLEHRASTALLCSRDWLPYRTTSGRFPQGTNDDYVKFLGLCSHEYFHAWNVKRIKPAEFVPYDLTAENYTKLLWVFEGFTSYYDDLVLVRSGLTEVNTYFKQLCTTINGVLRSTGHTKQSLAEASFDAWIKYYRQDENSPNALVSYYTKGSLVALALDLTIRSETGGERSLDDVMRCLWDRFGRDFYTAASKGVTDELVEELVSEVAGFDLTGFFSRYVHGTEPLPLANLFARFGLVLEDTAATDTPSLNIRVKKSGSDCVIANVYEGGAGHVGGLSAGDVLLAIDAIRVPAENPTENLARMLSRYAVGDTVDVHIFRRDELYVMAVELTGDEVPKYTLRADGNETGKMIADRQNWLKTK